MRHTQTLVEIYNSPLFRFTGNYFWNSDFDMIYDEGNDEQWNIDLLTASAVGDREAVQNILHSKKSHLNLDQVLINSRGWTPIMFAAYFGHAGLVSLLMEDQGFNVRDQNDKGTA